jgi:dethiobiotin synthetase
LHRSSQNRTTPVRIIFITGTDTGVGKTLLTGLLLEHLRQSGTRRLALKPYCSGTTADVDLLFALQDGQLSRSTINPFYFREPVAPLVSARLHRRVIRLSQAVSHVRKVAKDLEKRREELVLNPKHDDSTTPVLLIEGSGGLLVPLGETYTVADLIAKLGCEVIIAARNRLGTINHTLMTVRILQDAGIQELRVVLMNTQPRSSAPSRFLHHPSRGEPTDPSQVSNWALLTELLSPIEVHEIPFLGRNPMVLARVKKNAKKLQKTLAQICR